MKTNPIRLLLCGAIATASLAGMTAADAATSTKTTPAACSASIVSASKSPIKINFWEGMSKNVAGTADTGNEGSILMLVAAFNKAEAGKIVVNDINQSGGYTQTWASYTASLNNGTAPNVVMFDEANAQGALDTKSILPVSTCITNNKFKTTTFSKKVLGAYTTGKTIVGMPFSTSVPVMYYNQQAFTQAGIKSPPTTMTQLIADQTLLQKTSWTDKGVKKTYTNGVSIKYDPWEITSWLGLANADVVNNSNGHTARASAAAFGTNMTAKNYLQDLQTIAKNAKGRNVYNPSSSSFTQAYGNLFDVANGVSGITFDTTAALGTIQSYLGVYKNVTLGVAPLPTLTGKSTGSMPPGGNGLFINSSNSSSAQQAASWEFIQYLTTAANLAKWDADTGYLPIRSDEVSLWKTQLAAQAHYYLQPKLPVWYETGYASLIAGTTSAASEGALVGPYNAVNDDMSAALEALLTTPFTTTPAQALSEAASNSTADIKSYNEGL